MIARTALIINGIYFAGFHFFVVHDCCHFLWKLWNPGWVGEFRKARRNFSKKARRRGRFVGFFLFGEIPSGKIGRTTPYRKTVRSTLNLCWWQPPFCTSYKPVFVGCIMEYAVQGMYASEQVECYSASWIDAMQVKWIWQLSSKPDLSGLTGGLSSYCKHLRHTAEAGVLWYCKVANFAAQYWLTVSIGLTGQGCYSRKVANVVARTIGRTTDCSTL